MKKLCLLLAVCLLATSFFSFPVFAETETETEEDSGEEFIPDGDGADEDNSGEVAVIDDDDTEAEDLPEIEESEEAFIPEGLEKTIFGHDDRYVVNPTRYPYSAIGMIYATAGCGCSWQASGFMVSKNIMLTAAHCLLCTDHSSWAKNLVVYFGYRNRRNYTYKYSGRWYAWAGNLFKNRKYTIGNDWGVIRFYKNVGNKTGWFGTRFNLTKSYFEDPRLYYIAGYRDEKLRAATGYDVTKGDDGFLRYRIDTLPGTSGCPVFDQNYYAVGINIAQNSINNTGYPLNARIKNKWNELKKKK